MKGDWYKWKVDPFVADMVVVGAQLGHGKRANLYSDYTLAVLDEKGEFVTVAKAYSGITDTELKEIVMSEKHYREIRTCSQCAARDCL